MTDLVALLDESTRDAQLDVTIGSFGGSDAEVRFSQCFDGTPFVARGNNARTRERNRPACSKRRPRRSPRLASGYETSDPTAAIRAGVDRLAERRGNPKRWSSTPTASRPPAVRRCPRRPTCPIRTSIDQLVADCVAADQLPDADGVDIVIGGIGRTDQDLSAESVTFLIALNQALCDGDRGDMPGRPEPATGTLTAGGTTNSAHEHVRRGSRMFQYSNRRMGGDHEMVAPPTARRH